jgi:hypothetical protein
MYNKQRTGVEVGVNDSLLADDVNTQREAGKQSVVTKRSSFLFMK